MKVLIVGTGYVGLVTGVCFSKAGHDVTCVDKDAAKVQSLNLGNVPIFENELEELLREQIENGYLRFINIVPEPAEFDIALIAVGTPSQMDGSADLSAVFAVVDELGVKLCSGSVLATKSTVPVGTARKIVLQLRAMGRTDLHVASLPEFLREGSAVRDTLHPNRLIFGVSDTKTEQVLRELHSWADAPVVVTDPSTSEMIKYASNAFLATKISFINEIANICERVGADVSRVAAGMGLDPRIGRSFLRAGLGYGGSCFPKDTRALVNIAGEVKYDFQLLKAVVEVNQRQRLEPMNRLREWLGDLQGKTIVLLGVAFKPGTDDVRESPTLELSRDLEARGAFVRFCDPVVKKFKGLSGQLNEVIDDPYETLRGADAAILVTEWPSFLKIDWVKAATLMHQKFVFDGRNVLEPQIMKEAGLILSNIGSRSFSPYVLA